MSEPNKNKLKEVIETNAPCWAGEYAVAHQYFTGDKRDERTDANWLELQMFKEWAGSGVYGRGHVTVLSMVEEAAKRLEQVRVGDPVSKLEQIKGFLQFAVDEFDHYLLLSRAYEHVAPERSRTIEEMCRIPEGKKMIEMRQSYRDRPHGDLTVELTEGGGLGVYYGIRDAFLKVGTRSELDERILDFANATIRDETEHMTGRFLKALEHVRSDDEWDVVNQNLKKLFVQKLRERNQQFSEVFEQSELKDMGEDLEAGHTYVKINLPWLAERINL